MAVDPSGLNALPVLAELLLVEHRVHYLRQRVGAFEAGLAAARARVEELTRVLAPSGGEVEIELAALERRLARLERRRAAELRSEVGSASYRGGRVAGDWEARAVVRARWRPTSAARGDAVTLTALCDGLSDDVELAFVVRSLADATPIATLAARREADELSAEWVVPADLAYDEIVFEIGVGAVLARSPVLVLA